MRDESDAKARKLKVAEALAPILSAFHAVTGKPLQRVRSFFAEGSLSSLALDFDGASLVFVADDSDDSIDVKLAQSDPQACSDGVDASTTPPWGGMVGQPFGWGWITVNQQGYSDGVLLSFGSAFPQIALNVVASSIKIATIS